MTATHRLALWLVLAADAMFYIGLLGASRVLPHAVEKTTALRDGMAVGLLVVGRVTLRWRRVRIVAALLALSALVLLTPMLRMPIDSQWLLHAVVFGHLAMLAAATLAWTDQINLLWEFVIVLDCLMIASGR